MTATDYVPALVERAKERAAAERQAIAFAVEDAEALTFADGRFDVVLSTFGVMFTADHDRAAAEMLRVCRPGGTIAMANWTPDGFIGQVFKTLGRHLPPPPGARSPALWGTREAIERDVRRRRAVDRASCRRPSPSATARRSTSSPSSAISTARFTRRSRPSATAAPAFEADLLALIAEHNRATDGTMVVPSDYVEVVIRKA